jgi:hypothetical protein
VADYFTMSDTVAESNADEDLGSGGALVLPDMTDANVVTRHLVVGAGKDQTLYLADRDNMGRLQLRRQFKWIGLRHRFPRPDRAILA